MIKLPRLIHQMSAAPLRNWLIEAGAGYGKSVLINDLRSALPGRLVLVRRTPGSQDLAGLLNELTDAARRSGIADLPEELGAASDSSDRVASALAAAECSIAIDDIHDWDNDVGHFVLALAEAIAPTSSMMWLIGRGLPSSLAGIRNDPSWGILETSDLAMDRSEVAEVLHAFGTDDEAITASVFSLTAGWPAAVAAVGARLRSNPEGAAVELARYDTLIDGLMHGYLDGVSDEDIVAGRTLALLPFFDDRVAELTGSPGLVGRLAAAGIPMTRQADGWTELPEQFRASLIRSPRASGATTIDPRVTDYFVGRGEIQAAISACLAVGDNLGAARIVGGADYSQEAQLDPAALNAAMTTIGSVAEQVPRSLLVQAQVNVSHGAFGEGLACIERAEAAAAASDPNLIDPVHQEICLELGVWRHFMANDLAAQQLLERCERALSNPPAEPSNEFDANVARLLDLKGLLSTASATKEGLESARQSMTEALSIWRRLQEPRAAAATVLRIVATVLTDLGRRQEALELLDSLPAIGPMTLINRARVQLERASLLPYLGRGSEVEEALEDARRIAGVLGHEWLLGMAATFEARAASLNYDDVRVNQLYDEVEAHPQRSVTEADQGLAWCMMADALTRCGSFDRAAEALEKARPCEGLDRPLFDICVASLEAQSGDPAKAKSLLDELTVSGIMPERRWAVALMKGLCALRQGDRPGAEKHLQESFDEAAELGHRALPAIAERKIVEQLQAGEMPADEAEVGADVAVPAVADTHIANHPDFADVVEITLFDKFSVNVNGTAVDVPSGQITNVVKLLVLSNGRLVIDQVIDQLWPDADLVLGRQRLRNVLKRLRKVSELLVERSGEALALTGQVDSDFRRATAAADAALNGQGTLAEVTEAVRLNSKSLLSDDLYSDWAQQAQASHRNRLVKLLDRQASLAELDGEVDLAVAALEAANDIDGASAARIRHGCGLLVSVGRDAAAEALARRHEFGAEL